MALDSGYTITAITGRNGSDGSVGVSLRNKGAWKSGETYVNNEQYIDVVYYNGSSYSCIGTHKSSTTILPTNTAYWAILAQAGTDGTNGTDGSSSYVHIAWANSADGKTNFTTSNSSGASYSYIGVYSDSNKNDSQTPSDYTWTYVKGATGATGAKGDKGDKGATGATGNGIESITEYYAVSSSNTTAPTSWSTTVQTTTTTNKYLWNYELVTYTDGTTSQTTPCIIGTHGATGATGAKGATGNGIKSITEYYLVSASSSGVTTSTSGWSSTVQTTTTTNKYLWNYELVTYTDGTTSKTTPCIIGTHGATGATGAKGATGNGIKSITEYYLVSASSSGVTTSTSGWSSTVQTTTTTNKYLWNYELVTYTDGTTSQTTPCIIGTHGATGATGNGIKSITEYYLVSASSSGVTTSTSGWSTTVQTTTTTNKYLWNYELVTYTDGTKSQTTPCIIGTHGTTGNGIKSITEYYAVSSSNTTAPTSWSTGIQTTTTTNKYLWNYELVTYTDGTKSQTTPCIIGTHGATGNGIKSITEYYLVSASSSGVTTSTSGWSTTVQTTTTTNKYLWNYELVTYTDGTKSQTTPCVIGTHGATGDSGTRGLQTFSGTEIDSYFTPEITKKLTTASNGITSTSMAIYKGDLYQNTITGDVWVCTTAGTASTAKWTWEQRIINDNDNENVFRFFTPYNNQSSQFNVEEVEGETPFGNIGKLFHIARNGTASTIYSSTIPYSYKTFSVDNSKAYRYVCYFKCTATQGYSNYFGLKGYNTTNLPILNMSGATVNSAYFCNFSASRDYWQCVIGYIYPNGTTQATYQDAGIWNCSNGSKIGNCTNFQWASGLTSMYHYGTIILYTSTEGKTDKADAYIYDMRFEPVNDNMPTLNELLTGSNAGITLECNVSSLDFILRKDKSTNYQSQSFTVALRQGGAILTPSSVTISTSNSTGVTVAKSGTSTITVTVSTSSGGKTLPSGAIKITLPFGGVNYSIDIPISSSSSGKYLGLKSALPTSTTDCVLGNYFVASATFTSNNKTYTASYVYEYVCTAANTYTWQVTTEINTVETFGDILSLTDAQNAQAVAIVQRLVANEAFVNKLAAQMITFQHSVASAKTNLVKDDMMIYMGKNPRDYTATSDYQFAISKFAGYLGEQEMWKDMLITKILSSGLLALMITGCLEVTDDVKIANNSNVVDTGFYEFQREHDAKNFIHNVGFFNNQYVFISSNSSIFLSKELNSDFIYNDTLISLTGAQQLVHNCIVGNKMYCLTQHRLLSSSDLSSWDILLSKSETIEKGSHWKNKNKYVIQTKIDDKNSALYIFDFDSKTYNRFSLGKIDSFLISDDYVFVYVLEDNLFYVTDGESLSPINLSIPHADIGYTPFSLLASYNNKFYMMVLSPTQPATGFNYDFYEVSYAGGNFKATLLFPEKTLFFRLDYGYKSSDRVLTPYGIVLNYKNSLLLLDWDGDITDIDPSSDKKDIESYFHFNEGLAYFTQPFLHTVYVSENLKDWKSFKISLDSTHNNPYLYAAVSVNGQQLFFSVGYSSDTSEYAVDIYKADRISVGGCLKSLRERPYVQSYSLARTGYVKWNNGLLIQWGMANLSAVSNSTLTYSTITMPLSYNNINAFGVFTQGAPSGSGQNHCCSWEGNRSANSFSVVRCYTGAETSWLAIGYV